MHPSVEKRLKREHEAATVEGLASMKDRMASIEAKVDRALKILDTMDEAMRKVARP